jgi:hypothetical protein
MEITFRLNKKLVERLRAREHVLGKSVEDLIRECIQKLASEQQAEEATSGGRQ